MENSVDKVHTNELQVLFHLYGAHRIEDWRQVTPYLSYELSILHYLN